VRALGIALVLWLLAAPAQADCRLALALALDVSGSVDGREYRLQLDGLAAALDDPDVRDALLADPGAPVALAVFEWSGTGYQRMVQGWVSVDGAAALAGVTRALRAHGRGLAPQATGLGAAMRFGHGLIAAGPACWERTLDISGDGRNNDWPTPRSLRAGGALAGIRINALAVVDAAAADEGDLPGYFRAEVIQGPDAFVEVAEGFEDYARAMRRKLLKELQTRPVTTLEEGRKNLRRF
jgi:hypothetical protein